MVVAGQAADQQLADVASNAHGDMARCMKHVRTDGSIIRACASTTSAPTRIDLAGGTIDIWPLYLFHPGAQTLNAAISLRARATIETAHRRSHRHPLAKTPA